MNRPGLSPEELADLRRREASTRDDTRSREAQPWGDDEIAEAWPCKGCGVMVAMTKSAIALHDLFNRELMKRRESPLQRRGQCFACRDRQRDLERMEARAAARRPHEQREMPIDNPNRRRHP